MVELPGNGRGRANNADGTGERNVKIRCANRGGKLLQMENRAHRLSFRSLKFANAGLLVRKTNAKAESYAADKPERISVEATSTQTLAN